MTEKTATKTNGAETRIRHIRIPESPWVDAAKKANESGMTISEAVRALLRGYVRGDFKI